MQTITIVYISIAVVFSALLALFHYYYKTKKRTKKLALFSFFRFVSILALLLLLINPKFKQKSYYTEKPSLTIAIDNSSSIKELGYDTKATEVLNSLQNSKELQDKFGKADKELKEKSLLAQNLAE